ncbi:MAG: DNA-3-methyladenine glycosylase family protein [Acidimicrobiales bacterium]
MTPDQEDPSWDAIRLPVRPPHDTTALLRFLAARAIPGVEEVSGGSYRRTVATGGGPGILEAAPSAGGGSLVLRVGAGEPGRLALLVQRARRLFDLSVDPAAVAGALSADPALAPLVASRPGLRLPGAYDGFEVAVRVVLGQQVTVAGASTLSGRLAASLGTPLSEPSGQLTHLFPTPDAVAGADLATIGIPRQRAAALRALAGAVAAGELALDGSADRDETAARLLALPGIGPWTAACIAMRALHDSDAFPSTDLGLRRSAAAAGLPSAAPDLVAHAERWRPWRAYAVVHLWTSGPAGPAGAGTRPVVQAPRPVPTPARPGADPTATAAATPTTTRS